MTVYGSPQRPRGRASVPVPPPLPNTAQDPTDIRTPESASVHGRHTLRYSLAAIGVVAVLLAAGIGVVASGVLTRRSFDVRSLQQGVLSVLQDDYRLQIETVACPPGVQVRAGRQFTCDVRVAGRQQPITVRVLDDDGRYEVVRPS